jgi:phosphatidylserine decarboxylase
MMLRLTRHGAREMILGTILLIAIAVGLWFVWKPLALLVIPVWVWLLAFFRDPERTLPDAEHSMVSPADGKVSDITEVDSELLGGRAVRVGIFLSVFNCHINRSPCDGRVSSVLYKRGKFINAMSHSAASEQNESNTLVIADPATDRPIAVVKQIVGLIARRIICDVRPGDLVLRGQRFGMIKFGSRTELYIPKWLDPDIRVAVGQNVRGAADVIAVLRGQVTAVAPQSAVVKTPSAADCSNAVQA